MPDYSPKSLDRAFFAMRADPGCIPYAGGVFFENAQNEHYLYLENIPGLSDIKNREDISGTGVGAMLRARDLMECKELPMVLRRAAASVPGSIRGRVTAGGALCALDKRSSLLPVFVGLEALAVVRTRVTERVISVNELVKNFDGNRFLPQGALVTALIIPCDNFTNASFETALMSDGGKISLTGLAKVKDGIVIHIKLIFGGICNVPVVVENVKAPGGSCKASDIKHSRVQLASDIAADKKLPCEAAFLAENFFAKL